MKKAIKTVLLVTAIIAVGMAATACNKKNDAASANALAELNAKMEAMQAELDKAKSGNAAPEEIAKLESAVAEIAQQEQAAEQKQEAAKTTTGTTPAATTTTPAASTATATTTTSTPAASTSTSSGGFQMSGTKLTKYNGKNTSVTIPNNVTSIGESAFEHSSVTSTL
jgi:hypothetical protein